MKNTISIIHETVIVSDSFDIYTANLEESLSLLQPEALKELNANPASLARVLQGLGGAQELVLFNIIEHGELLRMKGKKRKAKQYEIGNPALALKMTQENIRSVLYVPLRIMVYENYLNEVVVEYDLPSSLLSQFNNTEINLTALNLDKKLLTLIKMADNRH